jgi:predicted alpha/beta-fold hydrolase
LKPVILLNAMDVPALLNPEDVPSKTLMSREQLHYQRCCFVLPADI